MAKSMDVRLYRIWCGMKSRCLNPNNDNYARYGGRGIRFCDEWQNYKPFEKWALSHGYVDELFIDRIDNDGDYCPENCRWVDAVVQGNNRSTNRLLTLDGVTQSVADWARELGVEYHVLANRVKAGWSDERILTQPLIPKKSHELNGEKHSFSEWEKITGISKGTLYGRCVLRGMSMEDAVKDKNYSCRYLSYNGKTMSIADWAREYGMDASLLRRRVCEYGWSMEKAISTPARKMNYPKAPVVLTYQGRSQSVPEWSKETGICTETLYDRKRKGWDDEKILTTPIRTSKNQAKTA